MTMIVTENDELASIKNFANRYGRLAILLCLFFIVLVVGINYWQSKRNTTSAKAAQIFQEMVYAQSQQDNNDTTAKGQQLMSEFKNTPYAQFAGLLLAKIAVNSGDFDAAAEKLRWVIDHQTKNDVSLHLAVVRLASILQQQGKLEEALKLVNKDEDPAFTSLYAQARGDIYASMGQPDKAREAYHLALKTLPAGVKSPLLQMKLLDLGSKDEA